MAVPGLTACSAHGVGEGLDIVLLIDTAGDMQGRSRA
jgi:hypothetical protein